jgi:hypothetical protein
MSANFLDTSGICAGVDWHMYFTVGPLGAPLPVPLVPHGVMGAHSELQKTWRVATTVTTEKKPTLQGQWAMLVVPHVFVPAGAPHPAAEPINLCAILAASSISPQLTAHSVTGQGQALLVAVDGAQGANLDCSDLPAPGISADFNLNSVMTSPTLGDYLSGLFSALCSLGYAWAGAALISDKFPFNKLLPTLEEIIVQALASLGLAVVQTLLDVLSVAVHAVLDPVNFVINTVAQQIQQAVDAPPALGR